jgi:hypothetical protein
MLAHKAVHEAHLAAEVIAGELQGNKELASAAFNSCVSRSKKCPFPWTASGRAIANGRDESFTKLLFSWFYRGDKCCDAGDNLREHKMPRVTKVFQTFNFDQTLPMVSPRIQFASIAKGGN